MSLEKRPYRPDQTILDAATTPERSLADRAAEVIWSAGIVKIDINKPKRISSDRKVPIYFNNRLITGNPTAYRQLQNCMHELIRQHELTFDVIVGVPTGALPHSIGLSWTILEGVLPMPSAYVPKEIKAYGDPSSIVGADISGKRVLLVEDHVTTGESAFVAARTVGTFAEIVACVTITEHSFPEAAAGFAELNIPHYSLSNAHALIAYGIENGLVSATEAQVLSDFYADPVRWEFNAGHTVEHTERFMHAELADGTGRVREFIYWADYM